MREGKRKKEKKKKGNEGTGYRNGDLELDGVCLFGVFIYVGRVVCFWGD